MIIIIIIKMMNSRNRAMDLKNRITKKLCLSPVSFVPLYLI